jgi:hypothetical protein
MEDIVTNNIYDYVTFVNRGKYHMAKWISSHGYSYMWFNTTTLVAYVTIFSIFLRSDFKDQNTKALASKLY